MTLTSLGDDVLRWASENGGGRWTQLSEATASCAKYRGRPKVRSWAVASRLADLGHLDIDWEAGSWSIAPPCLALSPGMGLCAYLAGWRTAAMLDRFWSATDELDLFPFEVFQEDAPTAVFVKCGSIDALEGLGKALGVPVVYAPADRLTAVTGLDADRRLGAPPPPGEGLERWEPSHLTWERADAVEEAGLYRFELHGRRAFRLHDDDEWFIVDLAQGQLQTLTGRDDVIRWHPRSRDGRSPHAMAVAKDVALPPLVTRAAVAASGLLPIRRVGVRIYLNISRSAASDLAENLGLMLGFAHDHISMEG